MEVLAISHVIDCGQRWSNTKIVLILPILQYVHLTGFSGFFKIDLNTIFSCNAFNFFLFLEFYASTFPGISLILRVKTTEIQRFDLNIL
jgi:hypothetical protein